MAHKLNLTDAERGSVTVTFNVNRYEAYLPDGLLVGAYMTKQALRDDFKANGIHGAQFDAMAQRKYLAGY